MLAGGRVTFTRARLTGITGVMAGKDSTAAMLVSESVASCAKLLSGAPAQASVPFRQTSSLDDSLTRLSPLADPDAACDLGIVASLIAMQLYLMHPPAD